MSTSFVATSYLDALYSHYEAVKTRIKAANPARITAGLLLAQDWPPTNVKMEAFYLLDLSDKNNKAMSTIANRSSIRFLQWVWIIAGTDLTSTAAVKAANRGDRFVKHETMKGELLNGLYPQFTPKLSWARNANQVWTGTPKDPPDTITWSAENPVTRQDKASGLIYGTAAVNLVDNFDQITA